MANGIVRIMMQVAGLSQLRNTLRGVVSESRRSDDLMGQSAKKLTDEKVKGARKVADESKRAARRRVQAEQSADQEILRSHERVAREEERNHRETSRRARQRLRDAARGGGGRGRGFGAAAAGAVVGAGSAVLGRVEAAGGAMGVPTREQAIAQFIQHEQEFIRLANQAGLSQERRQQILGNVGTVARATNADPSQLIGALSMGQNRFSNLEFFADNLESLARASQASGSSIEDWVGAVGEFQRQLGVSSEEVPDVIGAMMSAAAEGSIEAGDVAANFSGIMSQFVALRGEGGRGQSGAREFLAVAESMGASGSGPEQSRTMFHAVMAQMGQRSTQTAIERRLRDRNIFDREGRMTVGFDDVLQRLHESGAGSPAAMQAMGFNREAAMGMNVLMNRFEATGGNEVRELMGVSSTAGNAMIDSTMSDLMGSASGRAVGTGINAQVNFMENGERVVDLYAEMVAPLSELNTRFPLLSDAMGVLTSAATGAGLSLAALNIFGGGAAAAGGAAAGGGGGLLAAGGAAIAGTAATAAAGIGALAWNWVNPNAAGDAATPEQAARADQHTRRESAIDDATRGELRRQRAQMSREAYHSLAQQTYARVDAGQRLDPETIRAMAQAIGRETSRALATGAPADGRTPGEPGR